MHIFSTEEGKYVYLSKFGFKKADKIKTVNNLAAKVNLDNLIDNGSSGSSSSSNSVLLNVKFYKDIYTNNLLDDWVIFSNSQILSKDVSYLLSKNMNDEISSFSMSNLSSSYNGAEITIYEHGGFSGQRRSFIVTHSNAPFIHNNLSWNWMSGTSWWEKSFNDNVSSYKIVFLN